MPTSGPSLRSVGIFGRVPGSRCIENKGDTVGEVVSGGQGGEARGPGGGARGRAEPGGETLDVDRGRGGDLLEARPGQPAVAAAAQAERAHALREGALDPGPP